jgi:hypothetical protein
MSLIKLTLFGSQEPIYINPLIIGTVMSTQDGGKRKLSKIVLTTGQTLDVLESALQISADFQMAMANK